MYTILEPMLLMSTFSVATRHIVGIVLPSMTQREEERDWYAAIP